MEKINYIIMLVGGVFVVLGSLIKYNKMVKLIAGYNPKKMNDKKGFINWVGLHLIFIGITGVFLGILGLFLPSKNTITIAICFAIVNTITVLRTALGSSKYY